MSLLLNYALFIVAEEYIGATVTYLVVPPGFEPGSPGPKPEMMDHYTTGLRPSLDDSTLVFDGTSIRQYEAI